MLISFSCGERRVRFFLPHGYAQGEREGAVHLPADLSNDKTGAPAWAIQLHRPRMIGALTNCTRVTSKNGHTKSARASTSTMVDGNAINPSTGSLETKYLVQLMNANTLPLSLNFVQPFDEISHDLRSRQNRIHIWRVFWLEERQCSSGSQRLYLALTNSHHARPQS